MPSPKAEIFFHKENVNFILRNKSKISNWLVSIAEKHGKKIASLHYIFVNDRFLLKLNKEFLHHDTFTDIITFDYSNELKEKNLLKGEIYISIDRINENAKKFNVLKEEELHRVMAHVLLHLCGFKDKSANEKKRMRGQEEKVLDLRNFK